MRLYNKVQIHFKISAYRIGERAARAGGVVGKARLRAKAQNDAIHPDVAGDHVIVTANIRFCTLHPFHCIKKGVLAVRGGVRSTKYPTRELLIINEFCPLPLAAF